MLSSLFTWFAGSGLAVTVATALTGWWLVVLANTLRTRGGAVRERGRAEQA